LKQGILQQNVAILLIEVESVKIFAKENAWPQVFASIMAVGQSELVSTSTPCRMDDVGTENTFHCIPVW
jgi:hypothetical protein